MLILTKYKRENFYDYTDLSYLVLKIYFKEKLNLGLKLKTKVTNDHMKNQHDETRKQGWQEITRLNIIPADLFKPYISPFPIYSNQNFQS